MDGTRAARSLAFCLGLVMLSASCDTGDGKELQPYDPADYPTPVETTDVTTSFVIDQGEAGDAAVGGSAADDAVAAGTGSADEPFSITASWEDEQQIDARHTCDGENVAPAVSWGGIPEGTVEIALTLVDDSAVSNGQPFVHWAIAGLDPAEIALAEGDLPDGTVQALNFFGDVGYGGPCPTPGDEPHIYRLTAYALNARPQRADGTLATEFLDAIAPITISSTDLTATYQR